MGEISFDLSDMDPCDDEAPVKIFAPERQFDIPVTRRAFIAAIETCEDCPWRAKFIEVYRDRHELLKDFQYALWFMRALKNEKYFSTPSERSRAIVRLTPYRRWTVLDESTSCPLLCYDSGHAFIFESRALAEVAARFVSLEILRISAVVVLRKHLIRQI